MFLGTGGAGRGVPARRAGASPVGRPVAPRTGGETRRQDPPRSTQVSFGFSVIADNLGAHKVRGVEGILATPGAAIWYLPPYSADLDPERRLLHQTQGESYGPREAGRSTRFGPLLAVGASRVSAPRSAATAFGIAGTQAAKRS